MKICLYDTIDQFDYKLMPTFDKDTRHQVVAIDKDKIVGYWRFCRIAPNVIDSMFTTTLAISISTRSSCASTRSVGSEASPASSVDAF